MQLMFTTTESSFFHILTSYTAKEVGFINLFLGYVYLRLGMQAKAEEDLQYSIKL
jgi:hypothetical protein